MRALFMDFPEDPKVADIKDEYMYGPAFLVAPVTDQGATRRAVYLPAGCDWYNYWTNERLHGGQTIVADAPIETLSRQHPEFGFSHIQPTAVLGRVVPLEPLNQPARLGGWEGLIE